MRARWPATPPRASGPCWCAAPAARRATSSTRRPTPPRCAPTSARCAWRSSGPASTPSGTHELYLLGYRDSGMPDTEANAQPDNFANAPLDEAVGRLVAIIRRERPQVLVTYGDERAVLPAPRPHPGARDLRARVRRRRRSRPLPRRRRAVAAGRSSTTPASRSGASSRCTRRTSSCGEESPYAERMARAVGSHRRRRSRRPPRSSTSATTSHRRRAALLAHRTQIDPDSYWMRVPDDADARDLPVGGVRAGPLARRAGCRPRTSPRTICSPGCAAEPT